jgi:hypothetical protein
MTDEEIEDRLQRNIAEIKRLENMPSHYNRAVVAVLELDCNFLIMQMVNNHPETWAAWPDGPFSLNKRMAVGVTTAAGF